ncbi:ribulokinase [Fictibacillus terranigra]|uniref:Ribulokinase n=1 Tax=Fictibacillus terranigra TaxID=3058424 RepID=A0ABT8E911_9BACL|nr:ribulokinase [Fictibacillus sp. CENA-BCM004]MDN4074359.1 ribulokinase [Fictibacillus sp. CENA-BCM004]
MSAKYSIGIDFGTESGRVLVVNVNTGEIKSMHVECYPHGVITDTLPSHSNLLPIGSALQNPKDYLHVLQNGIPLALEKAGLHPHQIVGIGVDFTSSTVLPVDKYLNPLCDYPKYHSSPHAWVKLWKHHPTKNRTEQLLKLATERKEKWLNKLGNNISEEWMIPKIVEVFEEAPDIYRETEYFMEANDWIVSLLTNTITRSNCSLAYKSFWNEEDGFPIEFFSSIDVNFGDTILSKLKGEIKNVGTCAGYLSEKWADQLDLPIGLPVATGIIDAHSAVLGTGIHHSETLLMVMGTSTCHMMLNNKLKEISGISGVVKNAILPGVYAYEAGQSAVGDIFGAYVNKHIPETYSQEARMRGISIFDYLEEKANQLPPENGLIALDWHNGNRSILCNTDLVGALVGLTLHTKPEEIFRAYLESTAFSARIIFETYQNYGLNIKHVVACGGLPQKNALLMQIYTDVINIPIQVSKSNYAPAIGAAILGATAAGTHSGGFDNIKEAIKSMSQPIEKTYYPIQKNVQSYEKKYQIYKDLHDIFGMSHSYVMKSLKSNKNPSPSLENI